MQFPESWLRTFANPGLSTDELSHRLTMAGLEVEETAAAAPPFTGIVVAHIVEIAPHPDADKLRVCQVDDGSGSLLQIVCGAPNAAAGLKVPLARIGARLPGDMKISKAKMRGVESFGMLCSARELGISQDHGGLLELAADAQVGLSIREALDLDDTLFTIKLTPNRADCLSILGVAREVAALTGVPLIMPAFDAVPVELEDRLAVDVQAPDLCGRFAGRVVRGVNARAATPAWMKSRLERAGQRSISALVDISNYVMLELGRPTHVFDLQRVDGGLTVRWARSGETLELLNGQTVTLEPDVGIVAAGGMPESLAGIMGGEASAVTLDTTDIYLEAAFWWPEAIMGRSKRFKFSSEASHRFERGVDFDSIPQHLERMTRLIIDICGGQAGPIDDQIVNLPPRAPVDMRLARCHRILGVPVEQSEVERIFTSLNLPFTLQDGVFTVTPPSYRFDIFIEEDLIEEVARVYGFERIPDLPPLARAEMRVAPETLRGPHALRRIMAGLDYQEVVNFSFVEEAWETDYAGNSDPIRLLNPIASQLAVMRSGLIGGLVANIVHNANRKQSRVRVFELGRVFARDASVGDTDLTVAGVDQPQRLAGAAWGPAVDEQWGTPTRHVDFYDVKMDVEVLLGEQAGGLVCVAATHPALHPGRSARLVLDGRDIGWLGELHPRLAQKAELTHAPVVFEVDVQAISAARLPQPTEVSRQPIVVRDLAVWVDVKVSYQDLLGTLSQTIASNATLSVIKDIKLFDVWRDKAAGDVSEKSMAFHFWLQDPEVTLDDARVEQCMSLLLQALVSAHGVRLRA
ncbi:phenylalanine--tRNA ligase subunit beta [Eoetvoesiella caeni]|uniref:Phenylalanine--tRNA ligase beta subunit n=1 Tax=Eoetvoesiella caeni TaxID=645616 RepID=A0A366HFU3_9BURK|nr:phenylalanine--tRNA ligase subunit beta [Eoetvoesiella caeni]MCI2808728.1 phenylalanine--tRNA ligase subunit beta [Eoetvoesiella caeni]NYT55269.1 phenylalanine--tRNA ligase subunit beta [Eoetvoesiella caeni]RBP40749.1 phenylalanyl-tRNA synthetase beta subunit [Eoetvoesiella caeni]